MRALLISTLALAGFATAQRPTEIMPPLNLPEMAADTTLPNGREISRPLPIARGTNARAAPIVPVDAMSARPAETTATEPETLQYPPTLPPPGVRWDNAPGRQPRTWFSAEYTMNWAKGSKQPILALQTFNNTFPTLDNPSTRIALGGSRADLGLHNGGRFTLGRALDAENQFGVEGIYDYFGTATESHSLNAQLGSSVIIGRPLINARTGVEDLVIVAAPGMPGSLDTSLSNRMSGWTANLTALLYRDATWGFTALAGYRYFDLDEKLRIVQVSDQTGNTGPSRMLVRTVSEDHFETRTIFHGVLLGTRAEFYYGRFFAQLDSKISFGQTTDTVHIRGNTLLTVSDSTSQVVSRYANGVFSQPSNNGKFTHRGFAVLPESHLRMGVLLTNHARLYLGYNVAYLSDAVRATEQLDRVADLAQSVVNRPTQGLSNRPGVLFDRSAYWVQGLSFGLEWRY